MTYPVDPGPPPPAAPPSPVTRFFGGPPAMVLLRLVLLSVVVGVVFAALGLDPSNIVGAFRRLLESIVDNSAELIQSIVRYFLLGAIIVFPIWLIVRLMKAGSRS
jgi:hypothetical protein